MNPKWTYTSDVSQVAFYILNLLLTINIMLNDIQSCHRLFIFIEASVA